ncbi:MAG: mechanosensitive ion channel domain-containing protein [Erythrobacter sp.]
MAASTAFPSPTDIAPTDEPSGDPAADPTDAPAEEGDASAALDTPVEPVDGVRTADEVVEGVSKQSETVGSVLETLDGIAIATSSFRVSLLDGLVVLGVIALVVGVSWLLTRFVRRAISRFSRLSGSQALLTEKIITIMIWGAAFFIGIDLLGIDLTALAFFGGAFGLAIGFGLQKTFGNLIAGIILLLDKSIKPGDVIAVADMAGNETFGQIRKIGIRAVSVTTRDEREYLIPNENLMINQVENWSYSSKNVRMQVNVGISYGADMDLAEELMLKAAKSAKRVLETPPPVVWMSEYGDSSVNFVIHCWIRDPEEGVGNVRSAVLKNLWRLLKENDIEIPFPQRDLNLRDSEEIRALIDALGGRPGQSRTPDDSADGKTS